MKYTNKYLLLLIIVFAFLLRIYHANSFFFWQSDEDIIALTVKKILIDHDLQLIGFPIPGGFYLGPLIFYILSALYALAGMDPMRFPFVMAIAGTILTYLIYYVGKTIFEKESVGIIAAIIFAFSYLVNVYSRIFTGLTIVPFLSLFVYLILYKSVKSGHGKNFILLGLTLVAASQNEGTSLSLLLLSFIVWLIWRFKMKKRDLFLVFTIFLVSMLPLVVFELKHDFSLVQKATLFLSRNTAGVDTNNNLPLLQTDYVLTSLNIFPQVISRILFPTGPESIASQILPCEELISKRNSQIMLIPFLIAIVILGFFFISNLRKNAVPIGARLVLIHMILMILGLVVFNIFQPGYFYEWVTYIFFPGLVFMIAYFFSSLLVNKATRILVFIFLGVLIVINVSFLFTTKADFGLSTKHNAVAYALSQTNGQPFYLETIGSCNALGYLYLFWQQGNLPTHSYATRFLLTPTLVSPPIGPKPDLAVVMVHRSIKEDDKFFADYNFYSSAKIASKKIDGLEVLIVEDSKIKK